jgi:hypothetical protein
MIMDEETKKIEDKKAETDSTSIIPLGEATAETVFRREFANLRKGLEDQQKLSWQIVIGVAIAFLFTVGLVGVEIMLFHTRAGKDFLDLQNQYFQQVQNLREKNFEMELRLQKEIDGLKVPTTQNQPPKQL